MFFSTRGGRCGFSSHGGSSLRILRESLHGFIAASSLSVPPDTMTISLSLCPSPSTDCCSLGATDAESATRLEQVATRFARFARFTTQRRLHLLVAAPPGLPCFPPGSWGTRLCLLPAGFVFGIYRFLQSCKTKATRWR